MLPSVIADRVREHGLLLYDGECGFCSFWVQFVLDHDPDGYFVFAPLQAPWAVAIHGRATPDFNTVLLLEGDVLSAKSTAALRVAARLRGGWSLLAVLRIVPRRLRDFVYDVVARHRHSFIRNASCRLLSARERARFLPDLD